MDNLKCLSDHVSAHVSVDLVDAYETLRKELLKSMKIAKKFKEKLKLANLEKEELVVRLDESNKKNEFLRNQVSSQDEKMKSLEQEELVVRLDESNKKNEFLRNQVSSQDEKMKSLEQELVESKAKIENLTSNKPAVDNRSVFVSLKPKTEKVYITPFKRNNKENAYFARLDKGKSSDVDADVSKPMSKPTVREHNKSVFVPICHITNKFYKIQGNKLIKF